MVNGAIVGILNGGQQAALRPLPVSPPSRAYSSAVGAPLRPPLPPMAAKTVEQLQIGTGWSYEPHHPHRPNVGCPRPRRPVVCVSERRTAKLLALRCRPPRLPASPARSSSGPTGLAISDHAAPPARRTRYRGATTSELVATTPGPDARLPINDQP
jgi:hypothetical protein